MRWLRAVTGLYLLAYVTLHLINLCIGLVSLEAMDTARPYLSGIWTGRVLGPILATALILHYLLGLWSLYQRPSLSGTAQDVVQALSGLVIIPLLATHALGVGGLKDANVEVTYALLNRLFWLSNPGIGLIQVLLISVVWVHGCAGLFMGLRARAGAVNILPWLYPLAVAVPVFALLGYTQAGRLVLIEGLGPVIEQRPNADGSAPDPVPFGAIKQATNIVIWGSIALGALVLAARALRTWITSPAPVAIMTQGLGQITGRTGQTLLDAFRTQNQSHANLCSGRGRCGTCAVRILGSTSDLPPATPLEQATLDRLEYGPDVRLACQLPLLEKGTLEVARLLPPDYSFDQPAPVLPSQKASA
jgi:adenylate cyclase